MHASQETNTHFCHFHEWIDTSISRRDQKYVAWLKKVDDDVRKSGIDKAKHVNGSAVNDGCRSGPFHSDQSCCLQ